MANEEPFKVTISEDEYEARLTINPDVPGFKFNETKLKFYLKGQSIVYGIKEDVLARIVREYNEGQPVVDVLVAEGVRPAQGEAPAIQLNFEISTQPKVDESGHINYREMSRIVNAKAGQVLATKKKLKPAINGLTVTGRPVELPKITDIPLVAGANVDKSEDETYIIYKARLDGSLRFENNVLTVSAVLDIPGDVDFSIGNIHFEGDVKIGRDVLADFVVEAIGKISIWGSAIACKLIAREDVEIRGGMIGKNRGEIHSEKSITTNFVENARLFAGENITLKSGIIGSEAHCNGMFSVETKRSRIAESTVIAARGISCYNVGSPYSSNTRLVTGIHTEKEKEYLSTKGVMEEKLKEARDIERRYGRAMLESKNVPRGILEKAMKDIERWEALKEEIKEINNVLKVIEDMMYDYSAVIVVKEVLSPKVTLRIGKYESVTSREHYNVTVRFSPEEGKLVY